MKYVVLVWSVLLVVSVDAAEKRALSLDDLYRQEQVSDFVISPRGDEAVYVRTWYDVNFPGKRTSLWRVDGKTGRHEPLEPGEPDGRMPVYSPDGKLAFVSLKKHDPHEFSDDAFDSFPRHSEPTGRLWIRSTQGEIRSLSGAFLGGQVLNDGFFGRIAFSPDGKRLAVVESNNREMEITLLRRRTSPETEFVLEDQGEGYEGHYRTGILVHDLPQETNYGQARGLTDLMNGFWYGDPQWHRDGNSLVFHANRTHDQESVRYSINKNYDLWKVRTDKRTSSDDLIQLTHNPGPDVSPRVSPDGKHVLYLSVPRKGPHADVYNVCLLPLDQEADEVQVIVNAHDAEPSADGTPPFQPTFPLRDDSWIDNDFVRIRGVVGLKTETRVFQVSGSLPKFSRSATPEPEPHPNKKLVAPPINEWRKERFEAREEIVHWKSFDGLEIEGILTLPPEELTQFKKPYPVIVYPHGGPHSKSSPGFNFSVHLFAAQGYAVFQPNFRGSAGYGRKFLDAARFDMGGSDMQDILTGVDMLIEKGIADKDRQFVYGISYGGYSTCRLVGLTNRFKAACAVNAVTDLHAMWALSDLQSWTEWEFGGKPWETIEHEGKKIDVGALMRDRSPTTHAHKVKTPTLILHSDHDRRCPLAMGQMFYRCLKENGCETEMVVYKDERHGMWQVRHQADVLERTLAWFKKYGSESK